MQAMSFQTHKSANSQPDRIALGNFESALSTFNTGELHEPAMINFDLPGIERIKSGPFNGHIQVAGCPVF
jgi:hypothetical protein